MELRAFRLVAEGAPEPVDTEVALRGGDGEAFWIDVERPERERLEELLGRLEVAPVLRPELLDEQPTPLAVGLSHQLLLRMPVQLPHQEGECSLTIHLAAGRILTIHEQAAEVVRELSRAELEVSGMRVGTPSALLLVLVDQVVQRDLALVSDFRGRVSALARQAGVDLEGIELEEMISLLHRAEVLTAMLEDQLYAYAALPSLELPPPRAGDLSSRFAAEHRALEHVTRVLARSARRLEQIFEQRSLYAQDSTNRRLKVLTIVQAVFVPLTLVAGIYGMNFEHMPELAWAYAYFVALGGMALIASAALLLFWRHGWFD